MLSLLSQYPNCNDGHLFFRLISRLKTAALPLTSRKRSPKVSIAANKPLAIPSATIIEEPEVMPPDWTLSSGIKFDKMRQDGYHYIYRATHQVVP